MIGVNKIITVSLMISAILPMACKTANKDSAAGLEAKNDADNKGVSNVCQAIIVPQLKNQCLSLIQSRRFQDDISNLCGSIVVPQLQISCLSASADKIYSPSVISNCNSSIIPQEKVSCLQDNGAEISRNPENIDASDVCNRGVFTPSLKSTCLSFVNDNRFASKVAGLCNSLFDEKNRVTCLKSLANQPIAEESLSACFAEDTDTGISRCVSKLGVGNSTVTPVRTDNSELCSNIIVPQLKSECLGIVQGGLVSANAAAECKKIIVPQLQIECYRGILNKEYTDSEVKNCSSVIPQQTVQCLSAAGR